MGERKLLHFMVSPVLQFISRSNRSSPDSPFIHSCSYLQPYPFTKLAYFRRWRSSRVTDFSWLPDKFGARCLMY